MTTTNKGQPTPGELFAALRIRRDFQSVRGAAKAMGLSHTTISNVENAPGRVNMTSDTARRMSRLYSVPLWLIDKIASGALEELPDDLDALHLANDIASTRGRIHPVRFLGSVSAGVTADGVAGPVDYLGVSDYFLQRYRPEDLYLLEVTGDSMLSENARQYVPAGSIIIVHEHLQPMPGQVVVAWLQREDMGVLKVYEEKDGDTWLMSYNAKHPPIHVSEDEPAMLRGVMVANWTRAPGFRGV